MPFPVSRRSIIGSALAFPMIVPSSVFGRSAPSNRINIGAIGVGQIILTNAERVERNYFDTHVLEPECYRPLLIEGLQQARDTRLPAVSVHRRFKVLIEDDLDGLFQGGHRLIADPDVTMPVRTALESASDRVLIAVGPEGGWNDFERDLMKAHGFESVSMGQRTLRTDTACIALLALAHQSLPSATGTVHGSSHSPRRSDRTSARAAQQS